MANPITNLFSRKQDVIAPPALKALWAHLDTGAGIVRQLDAIAARETLIHNVIRYAEDLWAKVQTANDSIATIEADARYQSVPVRDLSAQRKMLSDLETEFKRANENVRLDKAVLVKLVADRTHLQTERDKLRTQTDELLRDAAIEEAQSLKNEYLAAREAMLAVARKVSGALLLRDRIDQAQKGLLLTHGFYNTINIPFPDVFGIPELLPEAAQRARNLELDQVAAERDRLETAFLTER